MRITVLWKELKMSSTILKINLNKVYQSKATSGDELDFLD